MSVLHQHNITYNFERKLQSCHQASLISRTDKWKLKIIEEN